MAEYSNGLWFPTIGSEEWEQSRKRDVDEWWSGVEDRAAIIGGPVMAAGDALLDIGKGLMQTEFAKRVGEANGWLYNEMKERVDAFQENYVVDGGLQPINSPSSDFRSVEFPPDPPGSLFAPK
jgi:hypothetical protein